MAAVSFETFANSLLKEQMHLVVGSTPESIRDEVVKSGLGENVEQAKAFTMACIVAAASVKKATDAFLGDPKMNLARQAIQQVANLNGATNMSVLVLAGHCFLTSKFVDGIDFVKQLRARLGQNDIWAGELAGGSTSDKRKVILKQHKTKSTAESARLFGSGYFKFTKLDHTAMTDEEARFWKRAISGSASRSSSPTARTPERQRSAPPADSLASTPSPLRQPQPQPTPSGVPKTPSPPAESSKQKTRHLAMTVGQSQHYSVPADVMDYLANVLHWDDAKIMAQVDKDTPIVFEAKIRKMITRDPQRLGIAGTTIGR